MRKVENHFALQNEVELAMDLQFVRWEEKEFGRPICDQSNALGCLEEWECCGICYMD